jgi:hypothetical protein
VDDVILDCQGYMIDGIGGVQTAINIQDWDTSSGYDNITVQNCQITNWQTGIESLANNSIISDANISNASYAGIFAGFYSDVNNLSISNLQLFDIGSYGVYADSIINLVITGILIENATDSASIGVELVDGQDALISDVIINNVYEGVEFYSSYSFATMENITVTNSTGMAIAAYNTDSIIIANSSLSNSSIGILLYAAQNTTASNNILNTTNNTYFDDDIFSNTWEGNYWGTPSGTGFSDTCGTACNGSCSDYYDVLNDIACTDSCSNNTDYSPLTYSIQGSASLNISAFDESTLAQIYFNALIWNSTASLAVSNAWFFNETSCNASLPLNDVTISISNSSYHSPRTYEGDVGNAVLAAYLLPLSGNSTHQVTFFVIGVTGTAVTNALVTIERQYNGSWTIIAQQWTDSAGGAGFMLDSTVQYLVITSKSNYLTRYDYIVPSADTYYLTLTSSGYQTEWWKYWNTVQWSCARDNSSYPASVNVSCLVNDSSGLLSYYKLVVEQVGTFGSTQICSDTNASLAGMVNCTIDTPANKTFIYTLYGKFTSTTEEVLEKRVWDFSAPAALKNYGLIPTILIIMTMGAAFLFSPVLGVAGVTLGLWTSYLLQLLYIPIEGLVGITIAAIVLMYELRI